MDLKKIIDKLHPYERQVIVHLDKISSFDELIKATGLKDIEVMRGLQWLANKKIITLKEELKEIVELDKNGEKYLTENLPEKRFLQAVLKEPKTLGQLKEILSKNELNVALGLLKSKAAVEIEKGNVKITQRGEELLQKESLEEKFLKKNFPAEIKTLKPEEKHVLELLKKRQGIIKTKILKLKTAELTELGRKIIKAGVKGKYEDKLTPEMLAKGEWKDKKFRAYDVEINVPEISAGKKQHYRRFLDEVRQKFMALGFTEMEGPLVETDFWDMDALYMPQFHSARDIHQAYYIKEPAYGKLDEKIVKRVKDAHEKGTAGSAGWKYQFDEKRTHRHLLRTQGTACSARMLASKELSIPGKYFGITRCFRYDVIDATHLPDFYQVEGIVVEEGMTLRHLFGLLKMFAKEFAETDEIKLVPAYFPFTEPSVELMAKHPKLGWIELGGAGIFRPEMVVPLLGKFVPVLAWGIGIDRIAMFKLGTKDIRELFTHDLEFLRKTKLI
jgi:phenylalanyl-tRNA synthetase alpha chain